MTASEISSLMQQAIEQFVAGNAKPAETLFLQVIHADPLHAAAHQYLGRLAFLAGNLKPAAGFMGRAAELDPNNAGWFVQYGEVLACMGEREKAAAMYARALALDPANAPAAGKWAGLLVEQSQFSEAEAVLKKPLEASPYEPDLLAWKGVIASRLGDFEGATESFQRAVKEAPDDPKYHACLGNCLKDMGRIEEAKAAYEASLRLAPNMPLTRLNYAIALLLNGELERGFEQFEVRPPALLARKSNYGRPFWNGERIATLMLWAEQGYGDVIQFLRYVPALMHSGVKVYMGVQPELVELLQIVAGKEHIFAKNAPVPLCDAQQLMMSLPRLFHTSLQTIPKNVPYIKVDEARIKRFGELLAGDTAKLKVGIAWSGRPTHTNDVNRSLDPALYRELANVPGVSFYSLQLGGQTRPPAEFPLRDLTGQLTNFADTAGLLSQLDLVISVDTSVVHLAGAMGKPVWVLLPLIPDWRWMMNRTDSPWYPTMRLYRQVAFRDWTLPLKQVKEDLEKLAGGK